jgi:hypothetical protein
MLIGIVTLQLLGQVPVLVQDLFPNRYDGSGYSTPAGKLYDEVFGMVASPESSLFNELARLKDLQPLVDRLAGDDSGTFVSLAPINLEEVAGAFALASRAYMLSMLEQEAVELINSLAWTHADRRKVLQCRTLMHLNHAQLKRLKQDMDAKLFTVPGVPAAGPTHAQKVVIQRVSVELGTVKTCIMKTCMMRFAHF